MDDVFFRNLYMKKIIKLTGKYDREIDEPGLEDLVIPECPDVRDAEQRYFYWVSRKKDTLNLDSVQKHHGMT